MFIMCIKFGGPLAPMTRMGGHFIRMLLAIDKLLDTKFNIDTLRHRPEGAAEDADEIIDYYMASWDQNHPEGKPQFRLQHYNAWRNFFSVFNGRPGRDGLTSYQSGFIHLLTPKVGLRAVGVGGWGEVGRERRWCGVWPGPARASPLATLLQGSRRQTKRIASGVEGPHPHKFGVGVVLG